MRVRSSACWTDRVAVPKSPLPPSLNVTNWNKKNYYQMAAMLNNYRSFINNYTSFRCVSLSSVCDIESTKRPRTERLGNLFTLKIKWVPQKNLKKIRLTYSWTILSQCSSTNSKTIEDPSGFAETELKTIGESWRRIPELASKAHSSNL
jgi:hypothetical protein